VLVADIITELKNKQHQNIIIQLRKIKRSLNLKVRAKQWAYEPCHGGTYGEWK